MQLYCIETLMDVGVNRFRPDEKILIQDVLKYLNMFSDNPNLATVEPHRTDLTTQLPVRLRLYHIPQKLHDPSMQEIQEIKAAGIIQ